MVCNFSAISCLFVIWLIELASDDDVLIFQKKSNFCQIWIRAPWMGRDVLIPYVYSKNVGNGNSRWSNIHFLDGHWTSGGHRHGGRLQIWVRNGWENKPVDDSVSLWVRKRSKINLLKQYFIYWFDILREHIIWSLKNRLFWQEKVLLFEWSIDTANACFIWSKNMLILLHNCCNIKCLQN